MGSQIPRLPRQGSLGVYNQHQSCWSPFSPLVPIVVLIVMPTWPSGSECKVPGREITRILQIGISWAMTAWITGELAAVLPWHWIPVLVSINLSLLVLWVWCCSLVLCRNCTLSFQGKLGALSEVRESSEQSYPDTGVEIGFSCDSST